MNANVKMIPAETIPGMEGEGEKATNGGGEFKYNIFDIVRTFLNAAMYPHLAQQ
jgi:hypothetical protein